MAEAARETPDSAELRAQRREEARDPQPEKEDLTLKTDRDRIHFGQQGTSSSDSSSAPRSGGDKEPDRARHRVNRKRRQRPKPSQDLQDHWARIGASPVAPEDSGSGTEGSHDQEDSSPSVLPEQPKIEQQSPTNLPAEEHPGQPTEGGEAPTADQPPGEQRDEGSSLRREQSKGWLQRASSELCDTIKQSTTHVGPALAPYTVVQYSNPGDRSIRARRSKIGVDLYQTLAIVGADRDIDVDTVPEGVGELLKELQEDDDVQTIILTFQGITDRRKGATERFVDQFAKKYGLNPQMHHR